MPLRHWWRRCRRFQRRSFRFHRAAEMVGALRTIRPSPYSNANRPGLVTAIRHMIRASNCRSRDRLGGAAGADYLIATYSRSPKRLSACIDLLLQAGGETRYNMKLPGSYERPGEIEQESPQPQNKSPQKCQSQLFSPAFS